MKKKKKKLYKIVFQTQATVCLKDIGDKKNFLYKYAKTNKLCD